MQFPAQIGQTPCDCHTAGNSKSGQKGLLSEMLCSRQIIGDDCVHAVVEGASGNEGNGSGDELSFHLIQFWLLDPCAAGIYSVAVRCGPIHDQGAYGAACVLAEIVPLAFDLMPSSVHMTLGTIGYVM